MIVSHPSIGSSSVSTARFSVDEFLQKLQSSEELFALLNESVKGDSRAFSDSLVASDLFANIAPRARIFSARILPAGTNLYVSSIQKLALVFCYLLWKAQEQEIDFPSFIAEELRQAKYFHRIRLGEFPVGPDETADAMLHQVIKELQDSKPAMKSSAAALFLEPLASAAQALAVAQLESTVPYAPKGRVTHASISQNFESKSIGQEMKLPLPVHREIPLAQKTDSNPARTNFQESDYQKFEQGVQNRVKDVKTPLPQQRQRQRTSLFAASNTARKSRKVLYWMSALTGGIIGGAAWGSIEAAAAFFS